MSVVGFDFGNESCIVAVARQRRIDVVLNDESKHETPAIVCFDGKQRFNGTAGAASTMMNPNISITQIKRLIGRQFSDPELQSDLKSFPFTVTEGPDGYPLIHACYLGENRTFTPTQILGMVLSDLKGIAEKNLNAAVVDCCIGIPVYFTDLQRRAVLDAATIAGLHPLRLIHETTATALAYGFYKTDLPENGQLNVAFVDIGHASMQVCISGFKKGQLKILSHAYDRCLGVRDFDEALFQHFASKVKEEYKIDVLQNSEACLRLRAGCEKLKKVLSANTEALLHIECLMDERDFQCFIKRDEFEQICVPILEQAKRPLEKALADAGLTIENVHVVEMVGSSSRVPTIIKILTDFFKKEPRRTMNASEFVARGCVLECAILSPNFKVCDFQVNESFPFSIALLWKGSAPDAQNGAAENQKSTIVFPIGSRIPSVKALNFYRSRTFSIDVQYADVSELQAPAKISTYTIGPFQSTTGERSKLKVKARLNLHGIVSLESATLFEEEKVEVPVSKVTPQGANKMENNEPSSDALPPSSSETDVNMQDAKGTADASGAENVVPESGDRPVQMETDNKSEAPKNKVKKTNIPMAELVYGGMIHADVQKTVEKEFEMALQDRVMVETKDKKNAVESYVYNLRNKLNDKYYNFVTASERDEFLAKLQEVEDWLCEDGEDNTKGVYIAKLEELKKQGDPIVERFKESIERGTVIDQLMYCINIYREAAMSNDAKFDHIDLSEKQKVITECAAAEQWLREKKQQQDSLPKYATPVLTSAEIRKKAEALDSICRLIMTKPKPAPAKPAPETTPTPPTQCGEQQQPQGEDPNASPNNADANPESGDKPVQIETDNKNYGSLDSIEPTKFILEKEQSVSDSSILAEIDRTMKKHVDNLLHILDSVSAQLTQLESRTRHLENSTDDMKISVGNNHESTDRKMEQLENNLREKMNSTGSGTTMASVGEIRCACGKLTKILSSTTSKNHGRRFMVCAQSNRDDENDCEVFQWIDGSSVVMDAQQLEEMNKKIEELDTRISLLDEVVSEKLEAIERRVADFGEKVVVIEQRVEEMVDEMEINEVKHYGWKCWMVAIVVFLWCLVNFGSY